MLRGEFESAGESSPEELRAAYGRLLGETIERIGTETVAERAGLDDEVVAAVAAGEGSELTLEAAAAILAADDRWPEAEVIVAEALDVLLMGMTTAVVDVDAVAAGVDADLDPKEVQQKVEGRHPITLAEYAAIHHFVASGG